jgi:hypothetical protein
MVIIIIGRTLIFCAIQDNPYLPEFIYLFCGRKIDKNTWVDLYKFSFTHENIKLFEWCLANRNGIDYKEVSLLSKAIRYAKNNKMIELVIKMGIKPDAILIQKDGIT